MALGSTQPLTEISTRNLPVGKGRPERKADNLTRLSRENVGFSTSQNSVGLHGQQRGAKGGRSDNQAAMTCEDHHKTWSKRQSYCTSNAGSVTTASYRESFLFWTF
jgi:hypothetical protein